MAIFVRAVAIFVRAAAIFVRAVAICLCRDTCGPPYYIHEFTQILSKTLVFIFVLYVYFQIVFDIHHPKIAMMILQFKLKKGRTFSTKKASFG